MAEKQLRLHPSRGFFLAEGFHLVNPEKPVANLPENYVASPAILRAIKSGVLIDMNKNILVDEKAATKAKATETAQEAPKANEKPEAKQEDVEVVEGPTEATEEEAKPKSRAKKTK